MPEAHPPGCRSDICQERGKATMELICTFNRSAALGAYPRSTNICLVGAANSITLAKHFKAPRAVVKELPSKLCRHNMLMP